MRTWIPGQWAAALLSHVRVRRLRTAVTHPVPGILGPSRPWGRQNFGDYHERPLIPDVSCSGGEGSGRAAAG
jgi:hypothetical protein